MRPAATTAKRLRRGATRPAPGRLTTPASATPARPIIIMVAGRQRVTTSIAITCARRRVTGGRSTTALILPGGAIVITATEPPVRLGRPR